MKIIECEQNTSEWFDAKRGVPSASNFSKIITNDGKPSKQRTKYMYKLAGEKVSGYSSESYQNFAMLRGIETEAEARQFYEISTGKEVKQVGFCVNEDPLYGTSPDGLVNDDAVLEIKCPLVETHVGYLLKNELPSEYFSQIQGQLLVTERSYCDFLSYYPGLRPLLIRVERDEKFLQALEIELKLFCMELNKTIARIGG